MQATAAEVEAQAIDVETDADERERGRTKDDKEVRAEELATEEPVRERRRWRVGRILKVLAAGIAIACTCALITLSVLMVMQPPSPGRRAAA